MMGIIAIIVFCMTETVKNGNGIDTPTTVNLDNSQKMIHSSSDDQLILEKLLKDYDQRVRPPPTNNSGIVKFPLIAFAK